MDELIRAIETAKTTKTLGAAINRAKMENVRRYEKAWRAATVNAVIRPECREALDAAAQAQWEMQDAIDAAIARRAA